MYNIHLVFLSKSINMIIKKSLHRHQTSNFYFIDYIDSGNMVKYCSVFTLLFDGP